VAITSQHRRAAASETLPLPAATSRTVCPEPDVKRLANDLQRVANDGVVARRSGALLASLDRLKVNLAALADLANCGRGSNHDCSPFERWLFSVSARACHGLLDSAS
jgi:hypothetical protein